MGSERHKCNKITFRWHVFLSADISPVKSAISKLTLPCDSGNSQELPETCSIMDPGRALQDPLSCLTPRRYSLNPHRCQGRRSSGGIGRKLGGGTAGPSSPGQEHTPHLAMSQGSLDNWTPVICPSHGYSANIYAHCFGLAGTEKLLRNCAGCGWGRVNFLHSS